MTRGKYKVIPLTESDKADICRMHKHGSSASEIAEYIGCHVGSVYHHLRKAGMAARRTWTKEENDKLAEMYNAGAKLSEIALSFNLGKDSVSHRLMYLRKLGYNIKYRKG